MKSLKGATVVAGALAVAGVAAPAFAYDTADLTPTSLNGGLNTLTSTPLDVRPLQHQSDALDTESKGSVLSTVKGATNSLNSGGGHGRLLGGLPLKG
ncbi:hypothetical protein AB0D34_44315 [Streptomyces sp. NPDC048420]|uniref:hypothetical protein n=1 Tax=Streptomyces sp. NPDC048420 TaxID=3155755 RepID=UPI00343A4698